LTRSGKNLYDPEAILAVQRRRTQKDGFAAGVFMRADSKNHLIILQHHTEIVVQDRSRKSGVFRRSDPHEALKGYMQ